MDQFATLLSSLNASLQNLTVKLDSHAATLTDSPSSISQAVPQPPLASATTTNAPASFPTFLSTTTSSTTGMSLPDLFHNVDSSTLLDIARHKFEPNDLYKLDPQYRDKEERTRLELDGDNLAIKKTRGSKDYPTLTSVLTPLHTYFHVLSAFALSSGNAEAIFQIISGSLRYLTHLCELNEKFQWPAVLAYHMEYHRIRRREMSCGDYSGWGKIDDSLKSQHLFGQNRIPAAKVPKKALSQSPSETCNLFNKGVCTSPCKYGRTHKCLGCGANNHGKAACTKN
ncbi:hypothetical protein K474DRAFT_1599430 [Panus rudis PR-1116 ss-1]|nr:hypothetical protein K474DRAFT_1599430 [Panus rudis PR-1116 ss-1]